MHVDTVLVLETVKNVIRQLKFSENTISEWRDVRALGIAV